jgi:uncharacterized LabA/DUF88 family protein
MKRTIVYIDGFNLYFGLREQGWRRFYWLNPSKFGTSVARDGQQVTQVKYFTSRIKGPPEKRKRQNSYLTAVKSLSDVLVVEGQYRSDPILCPRCAVQFVCKSCGISGYDQHEKMTDVNIATSMLSDAMRNRMDDAILVTGDSDQRPTLDALRRIGKSVYVVFPPKRFSADLKAGATDSGFALEESYRKSQFPDVVDLANGYTVVKPDRWMKR